MQSPRAILRSIVGLPWLGCRRARCSRRTARRRRPARQRRDQGAVGHRKKDRLFELIERAAGLRMILVPVTSVILGEGPDRSTRRVG